MIETMTPTVPQDIAATAPRSRRHYNPEQKDAATFVQTAEESGGVRTLIEIEVAPGGKNPLHYHKTFAEHFTVVAGEFGVQIGKQHLTLKAGEAAVVPIGVLHRWYNTSAEMAIVRVELRPGHAGFERTIQIGYGLARDEMEKKPGPWKNIMHLAVLIELSDTSLSGFVSAMTPVMRMIAEYARRKGIERELIDRYCF